MVLSVSFTNMDTMRTTNVFAAAMASSLSSSISTMWSSAALTSVAEALEMRKKYARRAGWLSPFPSAVFSGTEAVALSS